MKYSINNRLAKAVLMAVMLSLLISSVLPFIGCADSEARPDANTPVITWRSDGLFALVPPPTKAYGKILTDKDDLIEFEARYVKKEDFSLYVQLCAEKGFTSSVINSEFFYSATDAAGYKVSVHFNEARKNMKVTFDATNIKLTVSNGSEDFVGIHKDKVIEELTADGFTNIHFKVTELEEYSEIQNGTVESVVINSKPFEAGADFHKSDVVTVRYSTRRIPFYWSESDLLGKHYTGTEKILREAGFINVTFEETVITTDNYYSDESIAQGQVYKVAVDGDPNFWYGSMYLADAKVVISYYSYGVKGEYLGRDDKLSLYNYLIELSSVDLSKYSENKVEHFRDAYDNASAVLDSEDATEPEVRAAKQELQNAYGRLAKFKTWQKVLLYIGIGVGVFLLIGWGACYDDWSFEAYPWVMLGFGLLLAVGCLLILIL